MKEEQLIFLHIPKTAGTTLRGIVYAQYGETRVVSLYPEKPYIGLKEFDQFTAARKDQADAIIGHFQHGFHDRLSGHRSYRYATILREPISRCLSLYNHLRNQHYAGREISFKELMEQRAGVQFNSLQTRLVGGRFGLKVGTLPADTLQRSIDNIERDFAFVGITERFNESLLLASHELGWKLGPFKNLNISERWANNYTEELRNDKDSMDLLMELNEMDMRLYEYANQRLTEKLAGLYPDLQVRLEKHESIKALSENEPVRPNFRKLLGIWMSRRSKK